MGKNIRCPDEICQVKDAFEAMDKKERSTKDLLDRMGLKHRPTFRDNYLLPALKTGDIEMTIPDKLNISKQKYRKK